MAFPKISAVAAAVTAALGFGPAIPAAAQQIIGYKDFSLRAQPPEGYNMPGIGYQWFKTNYPVVPGFVKARDETGLWCHGTFDVVPSAGDNLIMAIVIDDPNKMLVSVALPGNGGMVVYSLGYIFPGRTPGVPLGLAAGYHEINVYMMSNAGLPAFYSSTASVLQCAEIALPESQP